MKRLLRTCLTLIFVLTLTVSVTAEFHRLVSITGGSGQRLNTALAAAGYTGGDQLDELTICVPAGNSNTLYVGNTSSVNASNGFPIPAGDCNTWRSAGRSIDATSYFLFLASTESIAVSLRQR